MMDRMGSERWDALVKALKKNFERDLLNEILPYLSTLTRLRLQLFDYGRIHLDKVFEACPLLEVFEVDPRNYADFPSPWVPREKSQPQQHATRDNLSPSLPHNPQSLALRSFILRNGQFAQSDLESLLAQTPHLQVLKLVSLRSGPGFEEDKVDLTDISNSTKTCLEYHGIVLRSFHYSLAYTSRVWSQCAMFHVSPNSTDWTFSAHDLLPVMIDRLRDTPNVVTRLEIYHQDRAKLLPDSGLHRYLCESPHLLHLKAPYAAYLLEHLDIYCRANISRRQDIYNDTLEQQPSKVWACRNLQTLHLGFHIQRGSSLENKMQSRIIYGYLSAVCPKIHDLRIDPYYQTCGIMPFVKATISRDTDDWVSRYVNDFRKETPFMDGCFWMDIRSS
ncbi:hypothetical protein FBU30_010563 [Linnemannia zychae]|nr:hypothetical protein FBU30_010563 [Linnemannia zychae]